jgi:hypothetical protein
MALQAFDLNRAGDTPVTTLKVMEVTPLNWHRFPAGATAPTPVWVRTQSAIGGVIGDDTDTATATLLTDQIAGNGPNSAVDYAPRTQAAKATAMGLTSTVDIARPRGYLEPDDPYATAAPAAPVITSLSPNTAVAVTGPDLVVTITGTGFTPWSTVLSGNFPIPVRYLSATKMEIIQKPRSSVAGIVQVVVIDHGVKSVASNFTFT